MRDPVQKLGAYVVARHSSKLTRAHFCAIHDTYAGASAEAVRLIAAQAAESPELEHTYYVLEIAALFEAGKMGLRSQER